MSPILELDRDDPKRELEFELDFLLSMTAQQRYALMFARSREMMERMIRHGHLKSVEIVKRPLWMKRAANRAKDREDLKVLRELKKRKSQK